MKRRNIFVGMVLLIFLFALTSNASFAKSLDEVSTWGYQLQDISVTKIQNAKHDLIVIDYSPDGTDGNRFKKEEVQKMKKGGKKIIAYLSIGEAEIYRFYWNSQWESPSQESCYTRYYDYKKQKFTYKNICLKGNRSLIGERNPNWDGNYAVKYWEKEWWNIAIGPYLEKIYEAGFDGVYLDLVDEYEYWSEKGISKKKTAEDMVKLVWKISILSRKKMGKDFLIIPQNGLRIINEISSKWKNRYWSAIDAVGVESLFFDTTKREKITRMNLLEKYAKKGKAIFVVEYTKKRYLKKLKNRVKAFEALRNISIIPFRAANDTDLNELYLPMN